MAKEYTKQHIVPQSYLDRFGTKDKKKTNIGTRLNTGGEPKFFVASTDDVGYIKNYYDVTDKDDPKYWEKYFAREIDTICGQPMSNIITKITLSRPNTIVLSTQDKKVLSKLIVAQMMRVPEAIDYVKYKLYPKIAEQVKKEMLSSLPPVLVEKFRNQIMETDFTEQYRKELMFNHFFDLENFERYCEVLQHGVWGIYVNTKRDIMPFMTSDNPVLVEGLGKDETGLFPNGLGSPTTCIFYPLSPEIALGIYSRYGMMGIVADKYDGRKTMCSEIQFIVEKNVKIIAQAYQHAFIPQPLYDELSSKKI